jgi:hypothetical protein
MNKKYYQEKCLLYSRTIMKIWEINNSELDTVNILSQELIEFTIDELDKKLEALYKEMENDEEN